MNMIDLWKDEFVKLEELQVKKELEEKEKEKHRKRLLRIKEGKEYAKELLKNYPNFNTNNPSCQLIYKVNTAITFLPKYKRPPGCPEFDMKKDTILVPAVYKINDPKNEYKNSYFRFVINMGAKESTGIYVFNKESINCAKTWWNWNENHTHKLQCLYLPAHTAYCILPIEFVYNYDKSILNTVRRKQVEWFNKQQAKGNWKTGMPEWFI